MLQGDVAFGTVDAWCSLSRAKKVDRVTFASKGTALTSIRTQDGRMKIVGGCHEINADELAMRPGETARRIQLP
jgi:hypothetical protein